MSCGDLRNQLDVSHRPRANLLGVELVRKTAQIESRGLTV